MRIVTWNINGLGSLKFPFRIHAHHTHRYPTADDSQQSPAPATRPLDDYDYDETTTTADSDLSATKQQPSSPSALWSRSVSSASGAGTAVDAAPVSPHDPAFPAFPSRQLILTDALVSSYDELIGYFQADIVCLQEVKIGRGRMDLLAKAVSLPASTAHHSTPASSMLVPLPSCRGGCSHTTLTLPPCFVHFCTRHSQPVTTHSSLSAENDQ